MAAKFLKFLKSKKSGKENILADERPKTQNRDRHVNFSESVQSNPSGRVQRAQYFIPSDDDEDDDCSDVTLRLALPNPYHVITEPKTKRGPRSFAGEDLSANGGGRSHFQNSELDNSFRSEFVTTNKNESKRYNRARSRLSSSYGAKEERKWNPNRGPLALRQNKGKDPYKSFSNRDYLFDEDWMVEKIKKYEDQFRDLQDKLDNAVDQQMREKSRRKRFQYQYEAQYEFGQTLQMKVDLQKSEIDKLRTEIGCLKLILNKDQKDQLENVTKSTPQFSGGYHQQSLMGDSVPFSSSHNHHHHAKMTAAATAHLSHQQQLQHFQHHHHHMVTHLSNQQRNYQQTSINNGSINTLGNPVELTGIGGGIQIGGTPFSPPHLMDQHHHQFHLQNNSSMINGLPLPLLPPKMNSVVEGNMPDEVKNFRNTDSFSGSSQNGEDLEIKQTEKEIAKDINLEASDSNRITLSSNEVARGLNETTTYLSSSVLYIAEKKELRVDSFPTTIGGSTSTNIGSQSNLADDGYSTNETISNTISFDAGKGNNPRRPYSSISC